VKDVAGGKQMFDCCKCFGICSWDDQSVAKRQQLWSPEYSFRMMEQLREQLCSVNMLQPLKILLFCNESKLSDYTPAPAVLVFKGG
jgi:hypothetical protein